MFEHVKRKYRLKREKYGDLFKTDRTKDVENCLIGGVIFISLSLILFISAFFVPTHFPLYKWMNFLSIVFLLMGLTFFLTSLFLVLYKGNSDFNRIFFKNSYVLNEYILIELVFLIGHIFIAFFISFFFVLFDSFPFYLLILPVLLFVFCGLFYLFSNFYFRVVAFAEIYNENNFGTMQSNDLKGFMKRKPMLAILLMLIPFANLFTLIILIGRPKEEGIVINKVG
jgi:hypothetical protein